MAYASVILRTVWVQRTVRGLSPDSDISLTRRWMDSWSNLRDRPGAEVRLDTQSPVVFISAADFGAEVGARSDAVRTHTGGREHTGIRGYPCCACSQARQTSWSQRHRERRRRDSSKSRLSRLIRTVALVAPHRRRRRSPSNNVAIPTTDGLGADVVTWLSQLGADQGS